MAFQMVDGDQRLVMGQRYRLGRRQPYEQSTEEAGSSGRGDGIEVFERKARLAQRLADKPVQMLHMGTRCNLGNNSTVNGVFGRLRQHDVAQDVSAAVPVAAYDGGGRLVAGRLDT